MCEREIESCPGYINKDIPVVPKAFLVSFLLVLLVCWLEIIVVLYHLIGDVVGHRDSEQLQLIMSKSRSFVGQIIL